MQVVAVVKTFAVVAAASWKTVVSEVIVGQDGVVE